VFGPAADEPLDAKIVAQLFGELAERITATSGRSISSEQVAAGALEIAVGSMANAVKRISVMRGYDVSGYTLQCFGGAGGQHACQVADALGMSHVFIHPLAGVLSAYGMGLADQIVMREAAVERELNELGIEEARKLAVSLCVDAGAELEAQGFAAGAAGAGVLRTVARVHIRYQGTDTALGVSLPLEGAQRDAATEIRKEFESGYRRRFAFLMPNHALLIESVSVECIAPGVDAPGAAAPVAAAMAARPAGSAASWICSICRRKPRARCSGTPKAGRFSRR